MTKSTIHNVNVASQQALTAPAALRSSVPVDESVFAFVRESREIVSNILDRTDHRLMVVVGPCSIHDREAIERASDRTSERAIERSSERSSVRASDRASKRPHTRATH